MSIAFRFCVLYFGLYILCTQMFVEMLLGVYGDSAISTELGALRPLRQLVTWTASRVFGIRAALVIDGSGSGDKIFDWTQVFCFLVIAMAGTIVWSLLERSRAPRLRLSAWFRLVVRLALGTTMVAYGAIKVIPVQMPAMFLTQLVEPFGNFSPMGILWTSIAVSPGYERFVGCAEVLGGILLMIPPTTTLGALIVLADSIEVFVLNMTYDVPVKLFSFHLIMLSVVLLYPEARRLADVFLFRRAVAASQEPALFLNFRANHLALVAQVVFSCYIVVLNLYAAESAWRQYGAGKPKSPLYGIWDVVEMRIDGVERAPLLTDPERWRRIIFDTNAAGDFSGVQHVDDTFTFYRTKFDLRNQSIVLTTRANAPGPTRVIFQRPAPGRLMFDGDMNGRLIHVELAEVDQKRFLLLTTPFHWVQEFPFNR
jgi:hypothetical protein